MKWVAVAYIIAVLVISAKAKAINDVQDVNANLFQQTDIVLDYQAKISE
ncbi:MAG: hypothetical protein V4654_08460 [Bdellovibrionota bacterium]